MDIQLKLETENKKLEVLLEKKKGIDSQIKQSQERIRQYNEALDKQNYGKIKRLLEEKDLTVEEAIQILQSADDNENNPAE